MRIRPHSPRHSSAIFCVLLILLGAKNLPAQAAIDAQNHARLGLSLAREGKLPEAEQELRQAVKAAPGVAQHRAQLASILGLQGKWDEALASFQKAVALDPANLNFRRETAAVQYQLRRLPDAEKNLRHVLEKDPDDPGATLLLGLVSEASGNYAKASRLLASQFALVISQPDRTVALLHSDFETGQHGNISKFVDVLRSRTNDPAWTEAIGRCAQLAAQAGDLQTSETLFALISAYPSQIPRYEDLISLELQRGRSGEAAAMVDRVISSAPNNADAWLLKGDLQLRLAAFQDALKSFTRARTLDPGNADAVLGIAGIHALSGDSAAAMTEYKAGVQDFPSEPRFYIAFAAALMASPEATEKYAEIRDLLLSAVKLDPHSSDAHYHLGQLALKQGNLDEAKLELLKSLQADPDRSQTHFALSLVYRRLGQPKEAARQFDTYEKLKQAEDPEPAMGKP